MGARPFVLPLVCAAAYAALPLALAAAEAATATIGGIVLGPAGTPVAGAAVSAAAESRRIVRTTDAHGRFRLSGLVPGTYAITVQVPGYAAIERSIVVAPGARATLVFRLAAAVATIERAHRPVRRALPALT